MKGKRGADGRLPEGLKSAFGVVLEEVRMKPAARVEDFGPFEPIAALGTSRVAKPVQVIVAQRTKWVEVDFRPIGRRLGNCGRRGHRIGLGYDAAKTTLSVATIACLGLWDSSFVAGEIQHSLDRLSRPAIRGANVFSNFEKVP